MRPVVLALLTALLTACSPAAPPGPRPEARPPLPGDLPDEAAFLAEVVRDRGHRDVFLPIVDPPLCAATDDHGIAPGETVVAVDLGPEQVCYPTNLLDRHEIVEHTLAGHALLATW